MYQWRVFLLSRKNIFDNKFSIKMFELTFCFILPQNHPGNEIPFTPHIITSFQREEGEKSKTQKIIFIFSLLKFREKASDILLGICVMDKVFFRLEMSPNENAN